MCKVSNFFYTSELNDAIMNIQNAGKGGYGTNASKKGKRNNSNKAEFGKQRS